jgi:hypothetical protein
MTTADGAMAAPEPLPPELMRQQITAECELAAALAAFQAQLQPAAALNLHAVVEAARPAFQLGFAYTASCSTDSEGQPVLEVTLLYRGGDQLSSQMRLPAPDALSGEGLFAAMAQLLAQLLGIPVATEAQHSKAEQDKEEVGCQAESPAPAASVARAASATEAAVDPVDPAQQSGASGAAATSQDTAGSDRADRIGTHTPDSDDLGDADPPVTDEALRPLSDEEREVLLAMVRAMRPVEARRQFQLAFRQHFHVPREARSIAGFITQQRHKDFLDRFQQELRS